MRPAPSTSTVIEVVDPAVMNLFRNQSIRFLATALIALVMLLASPAFAQPDLKPYSLESVRELAIKQAQTIADNVNQYQLANYRQAVADWRVNRDILVALGKPAPKPPMPPAVLLVGYTADGWPFVAAGPQATDESIEVTVDPGLVVDIGSQAAPGIYAVGPKDTAPQGHRVSRADGTYEKTTLSSPFGRLACYRRL